MHRWVVVVVAVVACKKASPSTDAASSEPDAVALDTTITVTRNNAPDVGVPVIFQAADGKVLATRKTDMAGVATAKIATPATLSVLQPFQVSTFVDVPPGDHLALSDFEGIRPMRHLDLAIPTDPTPGVRAYVVNHGCGDLHGEHVQVPVDCGTISDFLVRSESDQGDVGMIVALDVPTDTGKATVAGAFTPCTNEDFTITNTSAATTGFLSPAIVGAHGPMAFHNSELVYTSGSASLTLPSLVQTGVNQNVFVTATTGAVIQMISSTLPTSSSFTLDLGAALLPSYTVPPTLDIASHRILWQPSGGALTPDVTIAQMTIARSLDDGGLLFWRWQVVAPYVAGELAFPVLPVGDFDFNPRPTDNASVYAMEQLRVPGGYDAIRATALSDILDGNIAGFAIHANVPVPSQTTAAMFSR